MRKLFSFILVLCFLCDAYGQSDLSRVPYELVNDFETGELFAWEPYPYNQDEGYDALYYAVQTPSHNNSKYALARSVRANEATELYHGFTKRLNMWTTSDTRLRVAVYFQGDRTPEKLEISLGTFDGRRFIHIIQQPRANEWLELDLPASEFKLNGQSLRAGEHIQVVTISGNYSTVYYLKTYTILMDDFKINGERDRRFVGVQPTSTSFEMFDVSILTRHFFYGDNISLRTSPEENVSLSRVRGTLINSLGKVVKDNIPFSRSGNEWVNESIYKFSEKDVRGQWQIRLSGQNDQGKETRWAFRFLMPGKKVTGHPRLFFSADELKKKIVNEKSTVAKRILDKALQDTSFMNVDIDVIEEGKDPTSQEGGQSWGPYAANGMSANWFGSMNTLGNVVESGSLRYAFAGDAAAGEKAKKALLKLCSFSKWNTNWMLGNKFYTYYPVGETMGRVAYGYDMVYDLMTDAERKFVRKAIMEKGLKMFQRDMVEMNRMPSSNSNHIAVIVAGFGLAATAIYGDDSDIPYLEPYLSGIITKAKAFIDNTYYEDGSYGEPKIGYMNMASRAIAELLPVLERNFGIDYSTTTNVQNFYKYLLQASSSDSRIQDYGDGGDAEGGETKLGVQQHSEWFVHRLGNPFLYKFTRPYWDAGNGGYLGYLWYRDDITPVTRESMPLSKVFSAQGMVMRSGWDQASTIISTHVGPNSNHYHYDQGSFQMMTNGETLITDPGAGTGGYYTNLDYLVYNVQAIAHNVMLIDHDPESQIPADYDNGIAALKNWPRMIHTFAGKNADAITSELSSVYKGKLAQYNRTLLYTKTGPLFLFDQVKSKSPKGHIYDWLFHAAHNEGKRSISYSNNRVNIDRPNARLTLDIISPEIKVNRIRDNNDDGESFVVISSKPNLSETNFLAVLFPEGRPASGDFGARPKTTPITESGWIGAKVERPGAVDYGYFAISDSASDMVGGFTTNSRQLTVSFDSSGKLIKAYFQGSTLSGYGLSIKSGSPVTAVITRGGAVTEVEVDSHQATTIYLSSDRQSSQVLVNSSTVHTWHYNSGSKMLTLQIPAGRNDITIK